MDKIKILLVEDCSEDVEFFQGSLALVIKDSIREFELVTASSIEQATEILQQSKVNIIFLDLILNGELDYITQLEKFSLITDVPVVILTGSSHEFVSKGIYRSCAPVAVTSKPIPYRQLQSLLRLV